MCLWLVWTLYRTGFSGVGVVVAAVRGGQGSGGTMHLEERHVEKYANVKACNVGGNLFNLHIQLYHLSLLVLFWISQPMHGVSLWRQQNEKKERKL